MALFEVIQKTSDKRRGLGLGSLERVSGKKEERSSDSSRQEDPLQRALPRPAGIANGKFGEPKRPFISREGGRLNLSLNAITGSAVALGLLVLLAFVLLVGRWTKPSAVAAQTGPQWPADEFRKPDKQYLVIQNMGGTVDNLGLYGEAKTIAGWCTAKGFPATVNKYNGQIIVWSLTGFKSLDEPDAQKYARVVEDLGEEYSGSQGAKWNFSQRDARGKFKPVFLAGG
ncbi:MAG: hypothetical protein ACYTF6_03230 [Planctomycetota bacterium]